MRPFFSIIVPVYNREKLIRRCIRSIEKQTFNDWEAIIIDDGSTDGTMDILKNTEDPRIKPFFKENGGVSSARNLGLDQAAGQYICFLDSDDEYESNHLKLIHDFLKEKDFPECLVFTDLAFNFSGKIENKPQSNILTEKPNFRNLPYIITVSIHNTAVENERFIEGLNFREDNEFLDRVRAKAPFYHIEQRTVMAHRQNDNVTGNAFLVKTEGEKAIYHYIKTRKKFSKQEWINLYGIYSYLTFHHLREKNVGSFTGYLIKLIISSPICLFHFGSLKSTVNRFGALCGRHNNKKI